MEEQKKEKARWRMLGLATSVQAGATLVTYGIGPLSAIWQREFGWSHTQAGLLMSAVQLGPLLSMMWVGRMLDRHGERGWVGGGAILLGLTLLGTVVAPGFPFILFCLAAAGILYGTAQPGGSKAVARWFSSEERGLAMGIRQTGIPIGGAVAGSTLPVLSGGFGWVTAVGFQGSVSILCGLLFLIFYREPGGEDIQSAPVPPLKESLRQVLRIPLLVPILVAGFFLISFQMILVAHWISYVASGQSLSLEEGGRLLSVILMAGAAGRVILPWISDRFGRGRRLPFLLFSVAACLGGTLSLLSPRPPEGGWGMVLLCVWLGFFGIGWYSLFLVQVAESSQEGTVGLTVGFALTVNQVGIVLAPAAFGWVVDAGGYEMAWKLVTAGLLGVLLFLGSSHSRRRQKGNIGKRQVERVDGDETRSASK